MLFPHTIARRTSLLQTEPVGGTALRTVLEREKLDLLPDLEVFLSTSTDDPVKIAALFFVVRSDTEEKIGFGSISHLDTELGQIRIDVIADPDRTEFGISLEATMLVVNYAFATWDVGKIYFCATPRNFETLSMFPAMIMEEPEPPAYLRESGTEHGLRVLSIHRDRWEKYGTRFLDRLVKSPLGR
ncbi:GNAT family N-acetyltransferase [Nonomuraea sp. SYSU D8015]|uniref:GNAT family N-acetyltransferase n=1 Tax=Nonomuraea sp. SYSU D8015 TaxID=2593644 RepID=UPI001660A6ED|nr:GNAT family protein [Nonomuraea sp. SYSU D8015]